MVFPVLNVAQSCENNPHVYSYTMLHVWRARRAELRFYIRSESRIKLIEIATGSAESREQNSSRKCGAFGAVEYLTGERIVFHERERERGGAGEREPRGFCLCQPSTVDTSSAATATCISISAELGAIDAGRFIALFTAATAAIVANSARFLV